MLNSQIEKHSIFPLFSTDFNAAATPMKDRKTYIQMLKKLQVIPKRLVAPMFVLFDITSECNIGCAYCYNRSGCGNRVHMDRETAFKIAEELVRMKVFSVCVCGGEPTVHPNFIELIRYFHENGILVTSITNGYDLDNETIREMTRNLAIVQVTLDGPDDEQHDQLRGKGSFERAIRTIERLKSHNLHQLRVAFTCTKKNIESFPRMMELCLQIGANDLRTMQLVPVGRAFANKDLWPVQSDIWMVRNQIEKWRNDDKLMSRISVEWGSPHEHIQIGLLYGYMLGVNISPEGYYKISPYLPLAFGNAHNVSLDVAWKLGLGAGWLLPEARHLFESINSVDDYAHAYDKIMNDKRTRNGILDIFRGS